METFATRKKSVRINQGFSVITSLLVDAGGVLFNNINEETSFLDRLAGRYGVDPQLLRAQVFARQGEYESGDRHVHDVLEQSMRCAGMASAHCLDKDWIDQLYLSSIKPYQTVFDQLAWVRRVRNDLTLVLANNEAAHWDSLKNRHFRHFDLFHVLCSSWRMRAVKPDRRYFDRILSTCQTEADSTLLIDDRAAVVSAAVEFGIGAIQLTDPVLIPEMLREALGIIERSENPGPIPNPRKRMYTKYAR